MLKEERQCHSSGQDTADKAGSGTSTVQGRNKSAQHKWWLTGKKPSDSENRKPFEITEGINAEDLR